MFIKIKDGQPFEHPIVLSNFVQAFPNIDINNLPSDFAVFKRIRVPHLGVYEVYEGTTYEWDGDVVKDVHHIRNMTDEEKLAKQDHVKSLWSTGGYPSWTFDEESCEFKPPVEYPNDEEKSFKWDEATLSWIEVD